MHNCMNNIVYSFSCDPFSLKNGAVLEDFLEKTLLNWYFIQINILWKYSYNLYIYRGIYEEYAFFENSYQ